MSIERCEHCDKYIDTDLEAEHFEANEQGETLCEIEQRENPVWLMDK